MAIVLPCSMTPREFAAAGREVEMPRPDCPNCSAQMSFWAFTAAAANRRRDPPPRAPGALWAVPDNARPDPRLRGARSPRRHRGDRARIEQMAGDATTAAAAARAGVPYTTARGWRRRFTSRAKFLAAGFLAATVALGDLVPRLPAGVVEIALCAIAAVGRASQRRLGLAVTTGASPTASSAGICCRPTPIHPGSAAEGRL